MARRFGSSWCCGAIALLTACSNPVESSPDTESDAIPDPRVNDAARALLEELRDRHFAAPGQPVLDDAVAGARIAEDVLPPGSAIELRREGELWRPLAADMEPAEGLADFVNLELPVRATGAFRVASTDAGVALAARLR